MNLDRVKSVEDAKEANMLSKHLDILKLSWGGTENYQLQENVEQILEVLQPHTQELQELRVKGYPGAHFPQWMCGSALNDIKCLFLIDCEHCLPLQQLGELPCLKRLSISNMCRVIYIDKESYDGGVAGGFIALEYLQLSNLPNLQKLSSENRENMFQHLFELDIDECPNLLGLPYLPSLKVMHISGKCNHELLSSIHKLGSIESLEFKHIDELTRFPHGMLRNLT
ncbi:disease resistance protein, partial [Trifolium medium]|nr:disease resistance protein [Trifolium medium]